MSFLSHLSSRLTAAEHEFLHANYEIADSGAVDVLRDLVSLGSNGGRLLSKPQHVCENGCVCEAALILRIQCCFELQRSETYMREEIVEQYYHSATDMPYQVFHTWIEYQLSFQRYELCCKELIRYIDTHFCSHHPALSPTTSFLQAANMLDNSKTNEQYISLMEILLFHVLVPLGSHDEAIQFLKKGKQAKRGKHHALRSPAVASGTISVSPIIEEDEIQRLPPELKEHWMSELQQLRALKITQPARAIQRTLEREQIEADGGILFDGDDDAASHPHLSDATSVAFHAGLAQLHDSAFYARLPPANLPPNSGSSGDGTTSMMQSPFDGNADSEERLHGDDEITQESASRGHVDDDILSKGFMHHPALLPFMPQWSVPDFVWSVYFESVGHRFYDLVHPHAPWLANLVRKAFRYVWQRRTTLYMAVVCYVCLRLLLALLRYFRLNELPGVSHLIEEMKNFIKIAFISGTGRSLFA